MSSCRQDEERDRETLESKGTNEDHVEMGLEDGAGLAMLLDATGRLMYI